ncbi:hypothetical protein A0H81_08664 [Grifola frondosa]|uniref:Uncharacterized protein n=1 Tax=Grifola frondosa TaxID=5627 RepID=A0A1C7M2K6_GRIFR|nr:hypothetical protein A0H81_08664 [Grifola frondosa]
MYSRYPEYHYILDPSQWPSPVRCLALTLSQPLPACLTAVESDVSVLTEPSTPVNEPFSRFPSNPAFSPCQRDCSRHLKLKGIFDTVLSTVVGLRQLAAQQSYGNACPTIPLWYSLMKAIGMASLEGAYVLLLSIDKDEHLSSTPPTSLDDIAPKDAICSQAKERHLDGTSRAYIDDASQRDESHSEEDQVQSSAHDSDANISGPGEDIPPCFPICVADSDNIGMAISSVLYQRRGVARVLLGWLDLESDNNEFLPTPHIACADPDSEATTALGAYDLSDPIDALNFAQFIIGLDQCFDAIKTYTLNPRIQELPWRSDDVVISKLDDRAHSRVEQWAEEVAMIDPRFAEEELHPPASELHTLDLPPEIPEISDMAKKKGSSVTFDEKSLYSSAASKTSSRTREQASAASKPAAGSEEGSKARAEVQVEVQSEAESKAASKKSYISSSSLGNRTAGELVDGLTISTWLFERKVVGVGCIRIPHAAQSPEYLEINEMIDIYEEMTRFAWPKTWTSKDVLPTVDPSLTYTREALWNEYAQSDKTGAEELSESHTNIMSSRLSALLYATVGAYTLDAHRRNSAGRVNEAESRHDWDMLMYRFCVDDIGDVVSSQVLLERTLNFSRNRVMDEIITQGAAFALKSLAKLAEETVSLCSMQQSAVTSQDYKHRVIQQFVADPEEESLAASNRAFDFRTQIRMMNSGVVDEYVQERSTPEPRTGKCDAILVATIKSPHSSHPHSKQAEQERQVLNNHGLVVIAPPDATGKSKRAPKVVQKATPAEQPDFTLLPLSELNPHDGIWKSGPVKGMRTTPAQRKLLDDPLHGGTTVERNVVPMATEPSSIGTCDLALPICVVEYKKPTDDTTKALNQARSYVVSCVEFLSRLGIEGHPVFCVVTAGQIGGILLAWRSVCSEKIFIIERNMCAYRLYQPLEVFQFAIFLLRLQKWKKSLVDQLAELSVADFVKKASDVEMKWTKEIQVKTQEEKEKKEKEKAKEKKKEEKEEEKAVAKAKGKEKSGGTSSG